ncbi:MAG: ABC transporter, substrate-binding protein (cluster 4, leucine/isoleucine/valine/benzoate), partial [uncultured Acetobacteraceae bacterium]
DADPSRLARQHSRAAARRARPPAGATRGRRDPHRRADGPRRPLPRCHRPYERRLRAASGGGVHRRQPLHPRRSHRGGPPEQARRRDQHRAPVARPARRGRGGGRGQQRHRARHQPDLRGARPRPPQRLGRHGRADRPRLHPEHAALELRHLVLRQHGRHGADAHGRGQLVFHHRRLRLRPRHPARHHALRFRRGRAGARRLGLSLPRDHRLLGLPAASAGEPRQGARPRHGRRRLGELREAGAGVRPDAGRREARGHHRLRHRRAGRGHEHHARHVHFRDLLLGPGRAHPRLHQARADEAARRRVPELRPRRQLLRCAALLEGGERAWRRRRQGLRARGGGGHEADADGRRRLRPRQRARGRAQDPPGAPLRGEAPGGEPPPRRRVQAHHHHPGRAGLPPARRGRLPARQEL